MSTKKIIAIFILQITVKQNKVRYHCIVPERLIKKTDMLNICKDAELTVEKIVQCLWIFGDLF